MAANISEILFHWHCAQEKNAQIHFHESKYSLSILSDQVLLLQDKESVITAFANQFWKCNEKQKNIVSILWQSQTLKLAGLGAELVCVYV